MVYNAAIVGMKNLRNWTLITKLLLRFSFFFYYYATQFGWFLKTMISVRFIKDKFSAKFFCWRGLLESVQHIQYDLRIYTFDQT